jgi:AraC-like DNA-binding protein
MKQLSAALLNCTVRIVDFLARRTWRRVSAAASSWCIPQRGGTKLLEALQPFCDMAAKERATATGTLRAAVENEVEKLLPSGKAKKEAVAKVLALSKRTLSRRLADEGTTYEEVVDQSRRTLALQYIKDPRMSISQIAWLLGYEGASSFNHAFKRWTGRSPFVARNEKRFPAPQ